jgi:hypothetical protein
MYSWMLGVKRKGTASPFARIGLAGLHPIKECQLYFLFFFSIYIHLPGNISVIQTLPVSLEIDIL